MADTLTTRPVDEIVDEVMHRPEALEIHFVADRRVRCQGPKGPSGHPLVFYSITDKGYVECMYCDRVFVYDPSRAGEVLEAQGGGAAPVTLTAPAKSLP